MKVLEPNPRLAFFGSPIEAAKVLAHLITSGLIPVVVVSNPDARRSRGNAVSPTPVTRLAREHGIDLCYEPKDVAQYGFDLGIVVAYGRILREETLALAPFVNLHFSLLPAWRGAAPVERAILAGDAVTGVSLMEVVAGLDEGAVYASHQVVIRQPPNASIVRGELAEIGAEILLQHLRVGAKAFAAPKEQVGEVTYAKKITSEDLRIDFTQSANYIVRQIGVGGAWCLLEGKRVKFLSGRVTDVANLPEHDLILPPGAMVDRFVVCGEGLLELQVLQVEGKKPTDTSDWIRGQANSATRAVFS